MKNVSKDGQGWKKVCRKREKKHKHAGLFRYERETEVKLSMGRSCYV